MAYEIIVNRKVKANAFIFMGIIVIESILVRFNTNQYTVIILALVFMYAGRNIDLKKITKITFKISIFCMMFIILSSYLGIIENYVHPSTGRKYLGFLYVLMPSAIFFNCSACYLYTYKTKFKNRALLLLFVVSVWLFIETKSRLSFGLNLILLIMALILKYKPNLLEKRKILLKMMVPIFLICTIVSLYFTIIYSSNVIWMKELNEFLGTRLSMGKISIMRYGISAFGQRIDWVGFGLNPFGETVSSMREMLFVDNLYLHILQLYGYVFLGIYLCLHTVAMLQCLRKKDYLLIIIFFILALHGVIDNLTLYLQYNAFWFAIGSVIFRTEKPSVIKYLKERLK